MLFGNIGKTEQRRDRQSISTNYVGNLLTLIVLNRRLMHKSGLNNLLQGLAISDLLAPTIACIPHIIYYYGPRTNNHVIEFVNVYVMPIATGATFCSNWTGKLSWTCSFVSSLFVCLVLVITSFRLIVVVKPFYPQVHSSSRNEKKALLVIFSFGILSIVPYYYYHSDIDSQNVLRVISAVISLLIPWVICVILWILLIRIVNREIDAERSQRFILSPEIIVQRLKSKSKITRMVLIIGFFNIICQLPVFILTIFGLINGNPCGYFSAVFFVGLLFTSNLLLIVNHSINFFIYSLTNSKFRLTLKIMSCSSFLHDKDPSSQRQTLMTTLGEQPKTTAPFKHDGVRYSHSTNDLTLHWSSDKSVDHHRTLLEVFFIDFNSRNIKQNVTRRHFFLLDMNSNLINEILHHDFLLFSAVGFPLAWRFLFSKQCEIN